jgi:hypothetical protein
MEDNKIFGKNIYPCFQLSQRMLLSIQGISTFFFIKGLKIPAYELFTILKNSLAQMAIGVLAPVSAHAQHSARPPTKANKAFVRTRKLRKSWVRKHAWRSCEAYLNHTWSLLVFILFEAYFKLTWSILVAYLKPTWSLLEAYWKPNWSLIEAQLKPTLSLVESYLNPPWSLLEACLKSAWSLLEACLKTVWSKFEGYFTLVEYLKHT